jgi:2-polyprenyl-6-methoxyphenol hydroxylase-like FAD-dependent oxidoreductase
MTAPQGNAKKRLGQHAVVIGGSMGGLLAARVLSDHFEQVTIVERDAIGESAEPRKGVPQGRHVHVIFGGGVRVIERLFPGFFEELVAAGSFVCDLARDLCWYHGGVWKLRTESDLTSYWQSRPFLEAHVRCRVKSDTSVRFLESCSVMRLLVNDEQTRITGVEIEHRTGAGESERLVADLVVDAGGRGSRTPQWLETLGYSAPEETTVEINIGYASRVYERPADERRDWHILASYGTPPTHTRSGYVFPIEGNRWLVTAVGFLKDYPPDSEEAFLDFARYLETSDFFEAIKDARPLGDIATFKFPAHRWRHYERLARFPGGLLLLGDAVCSFNPVYGQGMSVCALEVDLLDHTLQAAAQNGSLPMNLARRFFRQTAKIIAGPWLLATNSDFLYPQTGGRRPFGTRFLNWYVLQIFKLCATNRSVLLRFYRVLHFLDKPTALFRPYVLFQVLKWACGLRGDRRQGSKRPAAPIPSR